MEKSKLEKQSLVIVCVVSLLSVLFMIHPAWSATTGKAEIIIDTEPGQPINLLVNKLAKLKSPSVIKRAYVVNPEIAELIYSKTQSPKWVFVSGKSVGTTQLTLWGEQNKLLGTFEIVVRPDGSGLKKSLYEIFPKENVSIRSSGDFITLTGTVSGSMKLAKILKLAEAFAPGKVINLLQVGGIQQVMLEVRIAEITKSVGNHLGINFSWVGSKGFGLNLLGSLIGGTEDGSVGIGPSVNAVLGFLGGDPVIVAIDALQEEGLLQILAKPTLIAQSGQNASFLAGGEFPYPYSTGFDNISIEWKEFGIGLNFTPTVLGDDTISLVISPEVSDLDFSNSVLLGGVAVPAIVTRRMSTVVELKDNQSFAIAGLLKNNVRESLEKFPILGDIPIIGALFRSTRYQKDETELVVIVTPHLVKPIDADEMPLPTDSFADPTPFEVLMLGMLEKGQDSNAEGDEYAGIDNSTEGSGSTPVMEGDFGYIVPE